MSQPTNAEEDRRTQYQQENDAKVKVNFYDDYTTEEKHQYDDYMGKICDRYYQIVGCNIAQDKVDAAFKNFIKSHFMVQPTNCISLLKEIYSDMRDEYYGIWFEGRLYYAR